MPVLLKATSKAPAGGQRYERQRPTATADGNDKGNDKGNDNDNDARLAC